MKPLFYWLSACVIAALAACVPPSSESLTGSDAWRDNAARPFENLRHD